MVYQISPEDLKARLDKDEPITLVSATALGTRNRATPQQPSNPLGELPQRAQEVPQGEGLVVVYCHHGVRSLSGAAILEAAGLQQVASLAGGTDRWSLNVDPDLPRY